MIVVATNNGGSHLPRLLSSMERFGTGGHRVCIVDTGSDQEASIRMLAGLGPAKYTVTRTPYKGYDTGAYVWAYSNYQDSSYLFMHDSMEVLSSDWVSEFESRGTDMCYYAWFDVAHGCPEQLVRLDQLGIYNPSTRACVFGPIFYARRGALDALHNRFDLSSVIPPSKLHQMGMEIGWAMMAETCGLTIASLGDISSFRTDVFVHEFYRTLRKFRPVRG